MHPSHLEGDVLEVDVRENLEEFHAKHEELSQQGVIHVEREARKKRRQASREDLAVGAGVNDYAFLQQWHHDKHATWGATQFEPMEILSSDSDTDHALADAMGDEEHAGEVEADAQLAAGGGNADNEEEDPLGHGNGID